MIYEPLGGPTKGLKIIGTWVKHRIDLCDTRTQGCRRVTSHYRSPPGSHLFSTTTVSEIFSEFVGRIEAPTFFWMRKAKFREVSEGKKFRGRRRIRRRRRRRKRKKFGRKAKFGMGSRGASVLLTRANRIKTKLQSALEASVLEVEDVSYQHAGHAAVRDSTANETHFNLKIVFTKFDGQSLVKRHQEIWRSRSRRGRNSGGRRNSEKREEIKEENRKRNSEESESESESESEESESLESSEEEEN
ncbi:hypothetical protein LguiA_018266 [Lonicera macranthoides]